MYLYHALFHAFNVFNILPLKDLVTADATTPFELWDLRLWSATSESLDVPVLPKSGQSQWMASLIITVRALREELEEYSLDFPQLRKDCYFMYHLPGRLSFLVMSFVMKPLYPLRLKLGDHFMML